MENHWIKGYKRARGSCFGMFWYVLVIFYWTFDGDTGDTQAAFMIPPGFLCSCPSANQAAPK